MSINVARDFRKSADRQSKLGSRLSLSGENWVGVHRRGLGWSGLPQIAAVDRVRLWLESGLIGFDRLLWVGESFGPP